MLRPGSQLDLQGGSTPGVVYHDVKSPHPSRLPLIYPLHHSVLRLLGCGLVASIPQPVPPSTGRSWVPAQHELPTLRVTVLMELEWLKSKSLLT